MARTDAEKTSIENISPSTKNQTLLLLQTNEKGIITRINSGFTANKRLSELGLVPGVEVEILNKISKGPIIIRVKGSKLALGRGLANKIEVQVETLKHI